MQVLIAIAGFMIALFGLSALISAYDRRLMLVEYGEHVKPCPSCGRACLGTRRRTAVSEPWGEWCSECCGKRLDSWTTRQDRSHRYKTPPSDRKPVPSCIT